MNIGICGPVDYDVSQANADYLEPTVSDLLMPMAAEGDFRRAHAHLVTQRIRAVNYLFPPEIKSIGPDLNADALDAYVELVLTRASYAGVRLIVYGSALSRMVPVGFQPALARDQLVANLRRWGRIASRHSATIVLEHLNRSECNLVTSLAEAVEIVREVHDASVRVVVDTYHMMREGESASVIRKCPNVVAHVHTAESVGRHPVGTCEDHREYFHALKDIEYTGNISIEPNWRSIQDQAPKAVRDLRHQYCSA